MKKSEIKDAYGMLIVVGIIGIFILLGVIGFYISNFHNNPISKIPTDWGSFGDFFGGILNPIISLFSLILLGYISYFVAKDSSNESNEMDLRGRRMDAYNELTMHLPSLDNFIITLKDTLTVINLRIDNDKSLDNMYAQFDYVLDKMDTPSQNLVEYHTYLEKFSIRYNHLFDFDLNGGEFNELIIAVGNVSKTVRNFKNNFESVGNRSIYAVQVFESLRDALTTIENSTDFYGQSLASVLNGLVKEIS